MPESRIPRRPLYESHIWGPHFWFFLHTVAFSYPEYPNEITKRKHYELIQNMPLFIPDDRMGNRFSRLLDKYPVSPYLGKRDSFIRWTVFIHNKMNAMLGYREIELSEAIQLYNKNYIAEKYDFYGGTKILKSVVYVYAAIILALLLIAFMVYDD